MQKVDKQFVSEIDKKLAKFDKTQPKSQAQLDEIEKYQKIYQLRDNANLQETPAKEDIWD